MEENIFGNWLREKRLDSGMTLMELSEVLDISYVTLSNLELNKYKPSISVLRRIAEQFDTDVGDIRRIIKGEEQNGNQDI